MTDKQKIAIMQLTDKTVIYGTKLALEELGNAILLKARSTDSQRVTLHDYKNTPVQILDEHELPD